MKGFHLTKSISTPKIQRAINDAFGLKKDIEHGYVDAPYYNGSGRYGYFFDL